MNIVGYADKISVAPGETIRFMVSCRQKTYEAQIVRLRHGDTNPIGPGFKEEPVESSVNGVYSGRFQKLVHGSYVMVPDHPLLRISGSFTLQTWLYATNLHKGVQGILTKGSPADGAGYGLVVEDGSLSFFLGQYSRPKEHIATSTPLRPATWYLCTLVYDAAQRLAKLYQRPNSAWPNVEQAMQVTGVATLPAGHANEAPFLIAATWDGSQAKAGAQSCFNGKIDRPRLFNRALSEAEIQSLAQPEIPGSLRSCLIAAWDFGRDFSSIMVTDVSGNELHGRTINAPARAVTGHNWTGDETDYRQVPEQYAAIHFHDDDLEDAGWDVDFALTISRAMPSGIYAARLQTHDSEDHVPFIVRPSSTEAAAPILFLAPTLSYLAYGNYHLEAITENRASLESLAGHSLDFD